MTAATLEALIDHYAAGHRNRRNELIHCICVPAIVFAVLGLFSAIGFGVALLAIVAALLYYRRLSDAAAADMALVLLGMLAVWAIIMPHHHRVIYAAVIFVAAWIGQFIGHAYEGAKPSFFEDLQYLMIGPLCVIAVLKGKMGVASAAPGSL
jgi:uncharacterized membrane protein YGL010W